MVIKRDIDLQSIQEVRNYLEEAKSAQKIIQKWNS
jgi:acetaldehyde dehydrogenase (acetylating)